ncbi:SDR family NAD(P)-dependent oxidoreductase [Hujiaoplasma nucleasis]|uniref:SDR family NAD(P)-dependent oxidoreductase n=1 Tax=Hujiaoplasma nucleasis TaxID=2725268 RepID=A0A7L6N3B2_9MOLU|nr:SDR family NAD(P)-dependent oxidoreductase [Hujiaoplasma nucleasis]QLY40663.1 SDR family NAD(P)-dependent oxidoreductase [Hujiaoplasma nucleasis]
MNKIREYINKFERVEGKTYIVTGANSGLGYSTSKHLISLGGKVIMACRNLEKANHAKNDLLKIYPKAQIDILTYDQADFNSIDHFVHQVKSEYNDFSGLVLNAGLFHPKKAMLTKDGYPLTIGTNYVGVFYLLKKLHEDHFFEQMIDRRIIFVGSLSWSKVRRNQIEHILKNNPSSSIKEYAQSKTLLGALAYQLSRHKQEELYFPPHVKALLMHPGVVATNIVSSKESSYPQWFSSLAMKALGFFVPSSDKASLGIIKLLLDKNISEDKIVVPRGLFHISGYPKEVKYAKKLRLVDEKLIQISQEILKKDLPDFL